MSSSRLTRILAAAGASGALVAGGLAFGGSPAAAADTSALTKTVTYSCSALGTPLGTIPVTFSIPADKLPSSLTQGAKAAAVPVTATTVVSSAVLDTLAQILASFSMPAPTSIGGPITGNALLGTQKLPFTANLEDTPLTDIQADGLHLDDIAGQVNAFTPASAGTQSLQLPSALSLQLLGAALPGADCTTTDDVTVGNAAVKAGKPVITAKAPKSAKVGKSATVTVTVKYAKSGKVTAKLGKKSYSAPLKNGKANVVVKGIKKGVNKIVVSFPKAASKTVKVTGKK